VSERATSDSAESPKGGRRAARSTLAPNPYHHEDARLLVQIEPYNIGRHIESQTEQRALHTSDAPVPCAGETLHCCVDEFAVTLVKTAKRPDGGGRPEDFQLSHVNDARDGRSRQSRLTPARVSRNSALPRRPRVLRRIRALPAPSSRPEARDDHQADGFRVFRQTWKRIVPEPRRPNKPVRPTAPTSPSHYAPWPTAAEDRPAVGRRRATTTDTRCSFES